MNTKFYITKNSLDDNIIGNVDIQTDGMRPEYNVRKANSIQKLRPNTRPDFEPDFDYIVIRNKAILTDFIFTGLGSSGCYRLMSNKAYQLLKTLSWPDYIVYATKLMYRGTMLENYVYVHVVSEQEKLLDIPRCVFKETAFGTIKKSGLKFENYHEYDSFFRNMHSNHVLKFEKCKFIDDLHETFDVIRIAGFADVFVSDRFVKVVSENNLTGLRFMDTDIFD